MDLLPARNAARPSDDPIFALNREATQRKAQGHAVINATVGALLEDDGQLAVLPTVMDAVRAVEPRKAAAYAPIAGVPEYLNAVIRDLLGGTALADMAVAASTPGGTGALRHAVSTFLERGQSVVTPSFYWGPYQTICDEHERGVRTSPMFTAAGGFDVSGFADALQRTAKEQGRLLVFLNDPCHNPTGYSMSEGEWEGVSAALREVSAQVPTTVLADVAYLGFAKDQRSFLKHLAPLRALRPAGGRAHRVHGRRGAARGDAERDGLRVPGHVVELQRRGAARGGALPHGRVARRRGARGAGAAHGAARRARDGVQPRSRGLRAAVPALRRGLLRDALRRGREGLRRAAQGPRGVHRAGQGLAARGAVLGARGAGARAGRRAARLRAVALPCDVERPEFLDGHRASRGRLRRAPLRGPQRRVHREPLVAPHRRHVVAPP